MMPLAFAPGKRVPSLNRNAGFSALSSFDVSNLRLPLPFCYRMTTEPKPMARRVAFALLVLTAPLMLVLAGLVLAGLLGWVWALLASAAVLVMLLPMLINHFQHLDTLLAYLGKLRRGGRAAIGMEQHWQLGSPFLTPQLAEALRETAREQERQQQRLES